MLALVSSATEQLFDSLGLTKLGHQLGLLMTGPRSPPKFPHSPPPARSSQKTGQEMKESSDVRLLGVNLTQQPKWIQLLVCTSGFFFGYITNGLAEEYVYNRAGFSYGWYFTFVQGFVYIGLILAQGFRPQQCVTPWRLYLPLSAVLMFSTGLTKGSLAYLNYPAQIMFKATKVLPVMLLGALVPGLRRLYSLQEYVSALLLVGGLILFTLADAASSPNFQVLGVAMVCTALLLDAILGNMQEAIFAVNPATSQTELLFCTTIVGMPFLVGPMLATGEVFEAWGAGLAHPYVYGVVILEAFATYIGQLSVLSLIALFGAATTAMVTTLRKVFTLLLSYLIFTKPLLGQHCMGLLLISTGIGLKMSPEFIPTPSFMKGPKAAPKPEIRYSPVDEERVEEGLSRESGER